MIPVGAHGNCRRIPDSRSSACRLLGFPARWRALSRNERQCKAHSSRRIRVEHGIAHLKKRRALARHLGRRERMSGIVQAVAGPLSHRQTTTLGQGPFSALPSADTRSF